MASTDVVMKEADASKKRKLAEAGDPSAPTESRIIVHPSVTEHANVSKTSKAPSVLVPREPVRMTAEVQPSYLKLLRSRHELMLARPIGRKQPELVSLELNVKYIRTAIEALMQATLQRRYHTTGAMRAEDITEEVNEIATLTADICMSALYHKLRTLHKSFGVHPSRYATAPIYSKEIELPLPLAIAIQEIGAFETHSMVNHQLLVPTYPESTKNEGRSSDEFQTYKYQTYIPTLKEHGIPCKSVNPHLKNGTAWWTYKATTVRNKNNLICLIPPSHYSDLSAQLRCLFLHRKADGSVDDLIKLPTNVAEYATRLKEQKAGANLRTFQALCHGYNEEWSQSAV